MFQSGLRSPVVARGRVGRTARLARGRTCVSNVKLLLIPALLAAGLCAAEARADFPDLQIDWWLDGKLAGSLNPTGSDLDGDGTFTYSGLYWAPSGAALEYNVNANPGEKVGGNLAVENLTPDPIDVMIQVILPVAFNYPTGTGMSGSAGIGLTADPNGGTVSNADSPVWQGLLDGVSAGPTAALFSDPFTMTADPVNSESRSESFGLPAPLAGPPATVSIGIQINFTLTPGDQASMTSIFRIVPGPGGLALAAGLLLFLRRRQRE